MTDEINEIPSSTPNLRTELAQRLEELVPEAIADGKVDVTKLAELLGDDAGDPNERFGLFWPGKKRALRAAQEPTTATLRPDMENSKDWDTTKNVFIEGDNLEVLKILQKHYHGKIKMIYIDPPYNTGKDFIYPDNYKEGLDTYLEWTKQVNEEGKRVSTNSESEGRYHSNWLNMMYPRLKLARNLLTEDGVIFISIDDHEVAPLRMMMDSIYGEGNFVENYFWESNFRPDNSSRIERENAQHIICFARNKKSVTGLIGLQKATEGLPSLTKSTMKISSLLLKPEWVEFQIPDGTYPAGDKGSGYELEDEVTIKDGVAVRKFSLAGRVIWSQGYLESQCAEGTKIVIKSEAFVPYSRKPSTATLAPTTLIPRDLVGDVLAGNAEIKALFGSPVFSHPKPTSLIRYLTRSVTAESRNGIVLDFFAGSGTTAHAVMEANAEDGGTRQFILAQLPEPTPADSEASKSGFRTIADVSRKRIQLAGESVDSRMDGSSVDTGFRAFKLSDTNFPKWQIKSDVGESSLEEHLLDLRESGSENATAVDLLAELLIKQGSSLTETISQIEISGLTFSSVGDGLILAYLESDRKPALKDLREALENPALVRFFILEDALQGDDELKTNLAQLCSSKGVELWTA